MGMSRQKLPRDDEWVHSAPTCLFRNPRIPQIIDDRPPALEGMTQSKTLARHVNLLHCSRKLFVQARVSAKIRLTLKRTIPGNGEDCGAGDIVYHKRDKDGRWKGPAKVLARDGQILHLGHGNTTIKTHDCIQSAQETGI